MILRHYRIIRDLHEPPRRPLPAAGRFWASYLFVALLVLAWWLA